MTEMLKVVNASKCRREFVLDRQTYHEPNGKLRVDVNGRPVQPLLKHIRLQQGANAVATADWDALLEADGRRTAPYLKTLLQKRILRVEPIKAGTKVAEKDVDPSRIEDLSEYTFVSAKAIVDACDDPAQLRRFIDHEPREQVRAELRRRYGELVEKERIPAEFELQEL